MSLFLFKTDLKQGCRCRELLAGNISGNGYVKHSTSMLKNMVPLMGLLSKLHNPQRSIPFKRSLKRKACRSASRWLENFPWWNVESIYFEWTRCI